ncbi:hypothetical protein PAERUG_P48_London_17_VIM_2_01_13_05448 [Pseudomonas aeruginosa]|nr:hypothetical protein PAERUG_P48_London_17_VIM_2_01_13_05448 [Pseudomonas aeruginosa]
MVQEQLAHGAVGIGEDVLAGLHVDDALVQVHRAARLAGHRLGHEGRGDVVLERGLAHGALEHQDLVGQVEGVAMTEVDLHLRGAFLVDQRIQVKALGLAPVVHVLEQRVELVGGVDGERLTPGFLASGAAHRGLQRIVGVVAALGQVELHLWRHDRPPALVGIHLQHALEDVARRQLDGIAELVEGVVDHHRGGLDGPGDEEHGILVRAADHIDVGRVEQVVVNVVFHVVAGDGLQQNALRQAHALFRDEFVGRRDLAAGDACQIGNQAFHFGDLAFLQPAGQLV